jgi:hypothetical protein
MPNYRSEKGPVVGTGAQRGAAKHPSEIVTHTGNSHNMIGALGDAKILPGIIMGCETIDTNGRPFTPRMVGTFLKVHTRPRLAYALRCRGY